METVIQSITGDSMPRNQIKSFYLLNIEKGVFSVSYFVQIRTIEDYRRTIVLDKSNWYKLLTNQSLKLVDNSEVF